MQNCVSLLSPGFLCPGKKKELEVDIRQKARKETDKSSIATTSFEQTVQIRDTRLTKETPDDLASRRLLKDCSGLSLTKIS